MEMVKACGFVELSAVEMTEIDGGAWKWYDYALTAVCPAYGIAKVYVDLYNLGYENGYNSTR